MENSLDAQATRIEIETIDGGKKLLKIRDNGTGIPADEVALAFRRYATSKLQTASDLEHIQTLGFRGEALSSIASVSKTTCTTRYQGAEIGLRIRLEGGNVVSTRTHTVVRKVLKLSSRIYSTTYLPGANSSTVILQKGDTLTRSSHVTPSRTLALHLY